MTQEKILEAALGLEEVKRIQLIERLLESLGPDSDGVDDEALAAELMRRSAEIDQGTAETIAWSELRNQ